MQRGTWNVEAGDISYLPEAPSPTKSQVAAIFSRPPPTGVEATWVRASNELVCTWIVEELLNTRVTLPPRAPPWLYVSRSWHTGATLSSR